MPEWVELRVHGVSGTPPEAMLGSAHVCQVAGDDRSRSFRPTTAQGEEVRGADGHIIEAFHWGRWTSGSWMQALWLLLVPFGMVNAAQFMLPEPAGAVSRAAHTVCGAALRLLALVLTALFTVGPAVVVVDLFAWQWLGRRDVPGPDQLLVIVALAVAALVVFLLSWIGQTYKGARHRFARSTIDAAGRDLQLPGLSSAGFFDGDPDNPTLRALHRAAGLALVSWLGLCVADAADVAWAGTARRWALAVLLAITVVVVLLGDPESTTSVRSDESAGPPRRWLRGVPRRLRQLWHGWVEPTVPPPAGLLGGFRHRFDRLGFSWLTAWLLLLCALALLVVAAVGVGQARPVLPEEMQPIGLVSIQDHLPGMDETAAATGIAGAAAVLFLLVAVAALAAATASGNTPVLAGRRLRPFRRFAWGMAAALAASVGFFLGIGLTAGLSLTVQGILNRLGGEASEMPPVEAPAVLQRVSHAWGLTLVIAVALALWALIRILWRRRTFLDRAEAAMTVDGEIRLPPRWIARVGRAMQTARLKKRGWLVLAFWTFALSGALLSLAGAVGYARRSHWARERLPWIDEVGVGGWWRPFTGEATGPGEPVTMADVWIGVGQFTLLGLAGGAVLLARGAIRAEGARRGLSVVWDVIAFWPRSVHPFVPPPYAQEVVPALVRRICWLLGEPNPLRDARDPTAAPDRRPVPDPPPVSDPEEARRRVNPEHVRTVVVGAHSQGSLIALAALLWLPEEARERVRFLTFGSQLRQQFPRAFPHYVTVELLRYAQDRHGWLNLYRDTDAIAGPVTSWGHTWDRDPRSWTSCRLEGPDGPVPDTVVGTTGRRECGREWRLLDPVSVDRALQRRAVARIRGHSDYWLDPDWDDALADVRNWRPADRVSPGPAAPPGAG
jgi:hypothetical protein